MLNEGNQIHNFISSSGSGSGSGSTCQKVTVPTVLVPVPQRCFFGTLKNFLSLIIHSIFRLIAAYLLSRSCLFLVGTVTIHNKPEDFAIQFLQFLSSLVMY
jgi:hypothetical protein